MADRVLQEFLSEAQEIVENLNRDLLVLESHRADGRYDPDVVNDVFRALHSLKGLAGLFAVGPMTRLSHQLESLLDSIRLGRVKIKPEVLDLLFDAVELYNAIIIELSAGSTIDDRRVDAFLTSVDALAASGHAPVPAAPAAPAAAPPAFELDPAILSVLTEYEEHRLRESIASGRTLYRIHAPFDLATIDKGLEELKGRLKPVGEVITYLPSTEPAADDKIDLDVILASDQPLAEVQVAVEGTGGLVSLVSGKPAAAAAAPPLPLPLPPPVPRRATTPPRARSASRPVAPVAPPVSSPVAPPFSSSVAPLGSRSATHGPAATGATGAVAGELGRRETSESAGLRSAVSQTVRVDIRKLDHLMNVVGELALARAGIATILEEMRGQREVSDVTRRLLRESRTLERKLNELQAGILEVRMVPLGQIFDRLARVVRRFSRDAGKEVRLTISGADTELDKLIVEELSDPLMHIIRNAIDHGIEPAAVRRSAGKPELGTVSISAQQKGNHVVLDVRDDGAGFDEARILQTALARGLLDRTQVQELSRRELLNLVFLPGFSTRDQATELSGRGVGMDVVKTNIAKLSGIIDLQSTPGKGTQLTITLPITLAIIQALIIRVAGRTYAVPLNSVLESLTITELDVRTIEAREVITLRGQTLSLGRVDAIFGLQRSEAPPERSFVVVVGLAQHRLGLVVDELIGQQDIVIKSLGRALAGVPGVAGATELGGQQIVLVLDVGSLVEDTRRGAVEAA